MLDKSREIINTRMVGENQQRYTSEQPDIKLLEINTDLQKIETEYKELKDNALRQLDNLDAYAKALIEGGKIGYESYPLEERDENFLPDIERGVELEKTLIQESLQRLMESADSAIHDAMLLYIAMKAFDEIGTAIPPSLLKRISKE